MLKQLKKEEVIAHLKNPTQLIHIPEPRGFGRPMVYKKLDESTEFEPKGKNR